MTDALSEFLAGDRPDEVAVYFSETVLGDPGPLAEYGVDVPGGIVLVLPGEQGRGVFEDVAGMEAMAFAGQAMQTDGDIGPTFTGECPSRQPDEDASEHAVKLGFAFAEEQNEEVGGLYAEGAVVHAYAHCSCGTAYSDRWLAGEKTRE